MSQATLTTVVCNDRDPAVGASLDMWAASAFNEMVFNIINDEKFEITTIDNDEFQLPLMQALLRYSLNEHGVKVLVDPCTQFTLTASAIFNDAAPVVATNDVRLREHVIILTSHDELVWVPKVAIKFKNIIHKTPMQLNLP